MKEGKKERRKKKKKKSSARYSHLPGAITKEVAILPPCHLCHPFSF
jgi:hypothetical protein